jgi:hypothetical protein
MTSPVDPPWLTEGGTVAVDDSHTVTFGTVARITKRDVVLDDGQRFSRARLSHSADGSWGRTKLLRNPSDQVVVRRVETQRRDAVRLRTARKVEDLMVKWRRDGDDNLLAEATAALETARARLAELDPA